MRAFRDLPIHQKLRRVILPIVILIGLIALTWVSVDHFNDAKHHLHERLGSAMKVLALNAAPAILLNDPQAADDGLRTLQTFPDVVSAVLYTKEGKLFAKYESAAHNAVVKSSAWLPRYETQTRPIEVGPETVGRIEIRVDLRRTYQDIRGFFAVMAIVFGAATLVALFLFDRLLSGIVGPLMRLTDTMGRVSREGDYNLRVRKESHDEIGTLVDGFNDMLSGIQARDAELARHRAHLEEEVAGRTAELRQALVEKELLVRKLDELASHDGLTGLYNHRMFYKLLEDELARAKRFNRPVSLLMIDIDHFKQVNDTYGHQAGDAIIKGLGNLLGRQARTIDRVCRYGGEEITVILAETENTAALGIAERLRAAVEQESFDIGNNHIVHITVSIGFAAWPVQATSGDELVSAADAAMYAAKQAGRNRVCRYEKGIAVRNN